MFIGFSVSPEISLLWLSAEKRPGLKKKMVDLVAAKLKKRVEEAVWIPIYNYLYQKFIYVSIYKLKTIEQPTHSYSL